MKLVSDNSDQSLLVDWNFTTTGDFNPALRRRENVEQLLDWLRDEFGRGETGLWSTQVRIDPPSTLPTSWYEEDTILGEYLRSIGRYQSDESLNLSLHEYIPVAVENELSGVARISGDRRNSTLRQAALLGVEYLGMDKDVGNLVGEKIAD